MEPTVINQDDVYWEMDWSSYNKTNPESLKPEKEMEFEETKALAVLLANDIVFLNSFWWEETWPEKAKNSTSLNVNCNDIFFWGCSDAENLLYKDIQDLYDHYIKDPNWGSSVWCIKKRNFLPKKPVYDAIMKLDVWNLDEMGLNPNPCWQF